MKDAENTIKNKREVRMSSRQKLETLWNIQINELLAKKKNNNEAKKEAKNHTCGFPVYIYKGSQIVAIVPPKENPLP